MPTESTSYVYKCTGENVIHKRQLTWTIRHLDNGHGLRILTYEFLAITTHRAYLRIKVTQQLTPLEVVAVRRVVSGIVQWAPNGFNAIKQNDLLGIHCLVIDSGMKIAKLAVVVIAML